MLPFHQALPVAGLIEIERRSAAGFEPVRPQLVLCARLDGIRRKSALNGCAVLWMVLPMFEPQYTGVRALYFGAERV
jgi:hypothetical protein